MREDTRPGQTVSRISHLALPSQLPSFHDRCWTGLGGQYQLVRPTWESASHIGIGIGTNPGSFRTRTRTQRSGTRTRNPGATERPDRARARGSVGSVGKQYVYWQVSLTYRVLWELRQRGHNPRLPRCGTKIACLLSLSLFRAERNPVNHVLSRRNRNPDFTTEYTEARRRGKRRARRFGVSAMPLSRPDEFAKWSWVWRAEERTGKATVSGNGALLSALQKKKTLAEIVAGAAGDDIRQRPPALLSVSVSPAACRAEASAKARAGGEIRKDNQLVLRIS